MPVFATFGHARRRSCAPFRPETDPTNTKPIAPRGDAGSAPGATGSGPPSGTVIIFLLAKPASTRDRLVKDELVTIQSAIAASWSRRASRAAATDAKY